MADWNISIQGAGCHHNGKPFDVARLADEFVARLRAEGHTVASAIVTTGSKIEVAKTDPSAEAQWANRAAWQAHLEERFEGK